MKNKQEKITKQKKPPKKPKTENDFIENAGKVFINLGQLLFVTLFLGGVLRGEIPHYIMTISGITGAIVFILFGLFISTRRSKDMEE